MANENAVWHVAWIAEIGEARETCIASEGQKSRKSEARETPR